MTPVTDRRARQRAETKAEIKALARAQMEGGSLAALSLNGIARDMGVSGPALYRYYASRDDLLTDLLVDAYEQLADTTDAVVEGPGDATTRIRELAGEYRRRALDDPARYHLLFGTPLPGYEAPPDRTFEPARRALFAQAHLWAEHRGVDADDPRAIEMAVVSWARLHGLVSLELAGQLATIPVDVDLMFEDLVEQVLALPLPPAR